jgi:hypothetical protein
VWRLCKGFCCVAAVIVLSLPGVLFAAPAPPTFAQVKIPRVSSPPLLEDFLEMKPTPAWDGKLAKVDQFIQRIPSDGEPVSQRTEAYLGYDDKNLYAVFICFDNDLQKVRARLSRREDVFDDDTVELMLDTFHDHRRAYAFFPTFWECRPMHCGRKARILIFLSTRSSTRKRKSVVPVPLLTTNQVGPDVLIWVASEARQGSRNQISKPHVKTKSSKPQPRSFAPLGRSGHRSTSLRTGSAPTCASSVVSILRQSRRLYGSRAPQRGLAATQSQNHKLQATTLVAGGLPSY